MILCCRENKERAMRSLDQHGLVLNRMNWMVALSYCVIKLRHVY